MNDQRENPFFSFPSYGNGNGCPPSLKGYFLISEANMMDPIFFQTVVLILEHNKKGAFGLVVNRRSCLTLTEIIPKLHSTRGDTISIYSGGPVQQNCLFALHSEMPEGHVNSGAALHLGSGLTFEPSFDHLQDYFEENYWKKIPLDECPNIHLFLGYSGWGPNQLEKEIQLGSWIYHPAHLEIVFHPEPEDGWREALRQKGGIYKIFANSKQNPNLN